MHGLFFIILLATISYGNGDELSEIETKIVGGSQAIPNEFPWAVRIQYKGSKGLLCGGTIVQEDIILTAAHCLDDLTSLSSIEVVAGEHDVGQNDGTEQTKSIKYGLIHQSYYEDRFDNDIGLLALTSKLTLNNAVRVARLPLSSEIPSSTAQAVGWGTTQESGGSASTVLMKVSVPLVNNSVCSKAYGYELITNSKICYGTGGKDSCQGDSGGGLICGNGASSNICGIVSFGSGCGQQGYPGVYTKVSSYLSWISMNLKENNQNCSCNYIANNSSKKFKNNSALIWITIGLITIIRL